MESVFRGTAKPSSIARTSACSAGSRLAHDPACRRPSGAVAARTRPRHADNGSRTTSGPRASPRNVATSRASTRASAESECAEVLLRRGSQLPAITSGAARAGRPAPRPRSTTRSFFFLHLTRDESPVKNTPIMRTDTMSSGMDGPNHYTVRTERVMSSARDEALQLCSPTVETEHLLLGLLHDTTLAESLAGSHITLAGIRRKISSRRARRTFWSFVRSRLRTQAGIPFSSDARRVLTLAAAKAEQLHQDVEPEHLMQCIQQETSLLTSEILPDDLPEWPARLDDVARPDPVIHSTSAVSDDGDPSDRSDSVLSPKQHGTSRMKLLRLRAHRYRSLRELEINFSDLNVFIGANASGKSTVLDALRFLGEVIRDGEFDQPVRPRGRILGLAWKGADAKDLTLSVVVGSDDKKFEWRFRLTRDGFNDFRVEEEDIYDMTPGPDGVVHLLHNAPNRSWWRGTGGEVGLKLRPAGCGLAAAAVNEAFPASGVAEFIRHWEFFDPNPLLLRRGLLYADDGFGGRTLAETLHEIGKKDQKMLDHIVDATRSVVGLPARIQTWENEGRFYFKQKEAGLEHEVHQIGISNGTARMLALMAALYGDSHTSLIGIEEPENYVHPTALHDFVERIRDVESVQVMMTTHSPLLLDYLGDVEAVRVVQRPDDTGTIVVEPEDAAHVREALEKSGFGLGQYYGTMGFGR